MNVAIGVGDTLAELEAIDLSMVRVDPKWSGALSSSAARRMRVVTLCEVQGKVIAATCNARVAEVKQFLASELELPFQLYRAEEPALRRLLSRQPTSASTAGHDGRANAELVVDLWDEVLAAASLRGASDIHLVPDEHYLRVSFRADGILEEFRALPMKTHAGLVNRIKVMAGLDIAEKREPQDGRFTITAAPRRTDVRVATIPTRFGERVTLRLLSPLQEDSLAGLGLERQELQTFERALQAPSGLVLLTGPTGSGKSTTLYTVVRHLQRIRGGNIITVEDPVEFEIPGTSQVEVDANSKVSFADALRSILRHDPDVIMLGEIRDAETAELAIKAALTGHLVLSTLHTNTAAGAVTRLLDMGVKPFLIAATLRLAVAQRLVRRLCSHCRTPTTIGPADAVALERETLLGSPCYSSPGCIACSGKGYVGRIALFEMFRGGPEVSQMICEGASESSLIAHMCKEHDCLLMDDGIKKILAGTTTVQQVLSAVATW